MRPSICVAALLLLLTTAGAVAQGPAGSGAPIARSTVSPPSIGAGQYVEKAVIADIFQIETSMVALAHGRDPRVKEFAQKMMDDHGRLADELKESVRTSGRAFKIPRRLDRPHKKLLADLNRTRDADVDRLYIQLQVKAHEEALALHTSYAAQGDDGELRSMAEAAMPIVQAHLKELRTIMPGR